jgi:hypothetical protein
LAFTPDKEIVPMGKIIVIYNDIIEINHVLEERGLYFKLHMRDACGSQSFWVEPLSDYSCEGRYEEMQSVITEYFAGKNISIRFLENKLDFVVVQP